MALVLKGNLTIDAADVSAQVTSFKIMGERDELEIPATMSADSSVVAGNAKYTLEISYLQGQAATDLSVLFYDLLADSTGTAVFAGRIGEGAIGTSNPEYTVTAVITSAELGGEVNSLGQHTVTLPCTARPTKATS